MQYSMLGRTDIKVSRICLGTMMFGELTDESDAHAQLSCAVDQGINFIDTAEMYPVPLRPGTMGLTEEIVGRWLKQSGIPRDQLVISTKVVGPPPREVIGPTSTLAYIREGHTHLDAANIRAGIEGSLKRLGTDYVDLFQPHWPDRPTNSLKKLGYIHETDEQVVQIEETLAVLGELVDEGKVRVVGVSNETPWGVAQYLQASDEANLPRIVSIQNAYNLLCRTFEIGLAEFAHREDCGLLAYSPLAMGGLTGKYLADELPADARLTRYPHPRYTRPAAVRATGDYAALARKHGLTLTELALAFTATRPFATATILGASRMEQLVEDIAACQVDLSPEVLSGIDAIHHDNSNPGP
ncbi:aldo/keto reductase [Amorphus sp. 3PC139-8]|uniref:aldo/keto reductase n=1 Tax=Amorphus sp. 3PC139-8 TaxID=2735676 RepID=UPI00345D0515